FLRILTIRLAIVQSHKIAARFTLKDRRSRMERPKKSLSVQRFHTIDVSVVRIPRNSGSERARRTSFRGPDSPAPPSLPRSAAHVPAAPRKKIRTAAPSSAPVRAWIFSKERTRELGPGCPKPLHHPACR